jgi:uncharacterized membrane protein
VITKVIKAIILALCAWAAVFAAGIGLAELARAASMSETMIRTIQGAFAFLAVPAFIGVALRQLFQTRQPLPVYDDEFDLSKTPESQSFNY